MQTESLIEKIMGLPPDKISEVEDFVDFLSQRTMQQTRRARHEAIAAYAVQLAGTEADLDEGLENAAIEHLLNIEGERR
jgi:Protein of unknown function (DUF2281)